jgi:hypothetical protein
MWRLIALFALGSAVGCLQATKYSYANASQTSALVRTLSSEGGGAE